MAILVPGPLVTPTTRVTLRDFIVTVGGSVRVEHDWRSRPQGAVAPQPYTLSCTLNVYATAEAYADRQSGSCLFTEPFTMTAEADQVGGNLFALVYAALKQQARFAGATDC
jgi:hypothetical protein